MENNELATIRIADQGSSKSDPITLTSNNSDLPDKAFLRAKNGKTNHEIKTKQFKEDNCLNNYYKDECFDFEMSWRP